MSKCSDNGECFEFCFLCMGIELCHAKGECGRNNTDIDFMPHRLRQSMNGFNDIRFQYQSRSFYFISSIILCSTSEFILFN
jgi:hypothetical protein